MRKTIKFLSCLLLSLLITTNLTVFASTSQNYNVSSTKPTYSSSDGGLIVYGTGKPSSNWNLSTEGTYSFSGSAQSSTLYTNYNFTFESGSMLFASITNSSSSKLTVKLVKNGFFDSTVKTLTIDGNSSDMLTAVLGEEVSVGSKYYLSFSAPSDFTGYIQLLY